MDAAKKRNLGQWDLDKIKIDGDYDYIPKLENYKLPKNFKSTKYKNSKSVIKVIDFFKTKPLINKKKCKECNMCVESCPVEAIDKVTKKIDYLKCIECMCCHELCLHKAVHLKKDNIIADILARLSLR
ncbi:MAG: 4Fe-4S binding protein [Dethiobacteria bacterium]